MPNHVFNQATIKGDKEKIQKILDCFNEEYPNMAQAVLPMPKEVEDGNKEGPMPDWYIWANDNWGTKWGTYDMSLLESGEDFVTLTFKSAWSPPLALYDKMTDMGYHIEAMYVEQGMQFAGRWIDRMEECYEYKYVKPEEGVDEDSEEYYNNRQIDEGTIPRKELYEFAQENFCHSG